MNLETYLAYLATVAVFFFSPPGPSQLLMITNSLRHGWRRSLATVAGDLSANSLQMLAAGFGLAGAIAASADLLTVIKWAGVAYLAWMGIRLFRAPAPDLGAPAVAGMRAGPTARGLYLQGFLTSAANPKAVVFFAALFPQFIDPNAPIGPQLLILGVTYLTIDGCLLVMWGRGAERLLGGLRRRGRLLNRVSGTMMISAAALLGARDLERTV